MKKNYIFTLLLTLMLSGFTFGQTVVITAILDGKAPSDGCSGASGSSSPKAIELYVDGTVDFTGYKYEAEANGSSSGETWSSEDISSLGVRTNEFVYIVALGETTLYEMYTGATANNTHVGGSSFNGNDAIRITDGTNVLDQLGDPSDVTGSSDHDNPWEYEDSYISRKDGSTANSGTFNVSNWNVPGRNYFDNNSITSCAAMLAEVKFGTFKLTASTNPSVSITSPSSNQIFDGSTTMVPVTLDIQNFTVSGDSGGGVSDNNGDGYLKATLDETGQATVVTNFFTATPTPINVVAGRSYTAKVELVDNSGNSLNPKVETSVSFSVALPCDIQLTTITKTCNDNTAGMDTYQTSIDFTGGNTGVTYTITAKDSNDNNVGTIKGDNPDSLASGKITVAGIPEGTNIIIKVVGGTGSSCDITRNITSPICYPLPILETFSYTENQNLIANPLWGNASTSNPANDIQVIKNDDGGGNPILGNYYSSAQLPDPTGNFVRLDGKGSDPFIGFEGQSTGTVYASFLFHITNMDDFKTNSNGGYFAILGESNTSFRARVWVKDPTAGAANEGLTFNVGISTGSTSTMHTGFTANLAEPVFVVMSYNLDNDEVKLWTVPDGSTFGTNTPPAANITLTGGSASEINRFILRQDSDSETPTIDFDELRIGTSWSAVTSNPTASVRNSAIDGFAMYPNPITNKRFTISSASSDAKEIVIFNVLGKKVFSSSFSGIKKDFDVAELNSGVYVLKVTEAGKTATKKLVIR